MNSSSAAIGIKAPSRAPLASGPTPLPGSGHIRAVADAHRGTVLTHVIASAPLRLFTPRLTNTSAWVYSTTFGGGLVGGDDIRLVFDVDAGARLLALTPASTKVYRSTRLSRQSLDARVGPDAIFVTMPDPVAPFAGSTFEQRQQVTLDERGSVLAMDGFTSGRQAFDEHWAFDRYDSRVEIVRQGRPIFRDHVRLDREDQTIGERMRPFSIFATMVAAGPAFAALSAAVVARLAADPIPDPAHGLVISASSLADDGMILRLAAVSVECAMAAIRAMLRPIIPLLGDDPWARRH